MCEGMYKSLYLVVCERVRGYVCAPVCVCYTLACLGSITPRPNTSEPLLHSFPPLSALLSSALLLSSTGLNFINPQTYHEG